MRCSMKTCMRHLQRRERLQRHPKSEASTRRVHDLRSAKERPEILVNLSVWGETHGYFKNPWLGILVWKHRVWTFVNGRCGKMESDALNDHHEFLAYEHWIHLLGSLTINTEYKEWERWECGTRFNACGVILYRSSSCLHSRPFVAENDVWKSAQTKAKIVHNWIMHARNVADKAWTVFCCLKCLWQKVFNPSRQLRPWALIFEGFRELSSLLGKLLGIPSIFITEAPPAIYVTTNMNLWSASKYLMIGGGWSWLGSDESRFPACKANPPWMFSVGR